MQLLNIGAKEESKVVKAAPTSSLANQYSMLTKMEGLQEYLL